MSPITSNNGELACVLLGFIGVALGLPAPITAVQILAIDLVGEMLPLTALTFDPPEKHILKEPPRNLNEHIINKKSLINLIFYGFWMGAAGYFSFVMVHHFAGASVETGRAAAYCGIILCQYVNILSRRTENTIFTRYLFTNKQLWGSFIISIIAVMILIYPPSVSIWFGFEPLTIAQWMYPITGALVFLFWQEVRKMLLRIK
jgi:Ca2+-transporting ATPase